MTNLLPVLFKEITNFLSQKLQEAKGLFVSKQAKFKLAIVLDLILIAAILILGRQPAQRVLAYTPSQTQPLAPVTQVKSSKEVFGFAPYWNMDKLSDIDFNTLTTLAYFGVEVGPDGNLVKDDPGYSTFKSNQATNLFRTAHANGTRVVLTLTQMGNSNITQLMDNPDAQHAAIDEAVNLVKQRGIDGINVDLEYNGDPGPYYRDRFSDFVSNLTNRMHQEVPGSKVTVSVYATSVKEPKIYNIAALGQISDGIFMMAYDFAVASSENAIPTSPLNGHETGKYWYDIAHSVDDFLRLIPSSKLILGVPYYGYNYVVSDPSVKAPSAYGQSQTYSAVQNSFENNTPNGVDQVIKGWDEDGKVGYTAYRIARSGAWRMIFMEDTTSLGIKYDFAKEKDLGGVGIWALGNDQGRGELWNLLKEKFGAKQITDKSLPTKEVKDVND